MEVEARHSFSPCCDQHTAKRANKDRMNAMNSGEEKCWEHFPCPFCDIDIELPFLCRHLEEEHFFSFKNTVCPICADFPEKDMLTHFTVQHSNLLKRTHSTQVNLWPPTLGELEKVPDDGSSLFETALRYRDMQSLDPAPDPLLSQFIYNFTMPDNISREVSQSANNTSASPHDARLDRRTSGTLIQQDLTERLKRIEFLSDILLSTIF